MARVKGFWVIRHIDHPVILHKMRRKYRTATAQVVSLYIQTMEVQRLSKFRDVASLAKVVSEPLLSPYYVPDRAFCVFATDLMTQGYTNLSERLFPMPRRKNKQKDSWRIINRELSTKEKEAYKKRPPVDTIQLIDEITTVMELGHKMSWSHNPENEMFICSLTCKDEDSPNYMATLIARHLTPLQATSLLLFKVLDLIGDDDWDELEVEQDWG